MSALIKNMASPACFLIQCAVLYWFLWYVWVSHSLKRTKKQIAKQKSPDTVASLLLVDGY